MDDAAKTPHASLPREQEPLSLLEGLLAPARAVHYLLRNPRLMKYILLPLLINLALMPLVFWLIWHYASGWAFGGLDAAKDYAWWLDILIFLGKTLLALVTVAVSALIFLALALALGAPFHSWLSERIEKDLLAARPELICIPNRTLWEDAWISVTGSVKRLILAIPAVILGFALGFIPVVGPVIAAAFNITCVVLFLALDSFTYPLERRDTPVRRRVKWVLRNYRYALGFGLPFFLIPCAFFVVPPLSAVAATREYCELLLAETPRESPDEPGDDS
ncbi:EI24 domain-containing protein [Candidatus Sumerlaeota bacterium]|nr:EI24 domain-containing protein [Candidatus Sumerlaeota bacterium]